MITTEHMGLTLWDLLADDFEHSKLADNFTIIDQHNHAGTVLSGQYEDGSLISEKEYAEGKHPHVVSEPTATTEILNYAEGNTAEAQWIAAGSGEAVNTPETREHDGNKTAIKPETIWRYLLARRAVGHLQIDKEGVWRENLKNEAVNEEKLADEAVSSRKLKKGVIPLGTVVAWYKSPAEETPGGPWELCDGREWNAVTNNMGAGEEKLKVGTMPDLRKTFIRGADLSGAGETSIGAKGGKSNLAIAHTHTVNAHAHTVNAHAHGLSNHKHNAGNLSLKIDYDGVHSHKFAGGLVIQSRMNAFDVIGSGNKVKTNVGEKLVNKQSLYVATFNEGIEETNTAAMDTGIYSSSGFSEHNHGEWAGSHGRSGETGEAGAGNTSAVGLETNGTPLVTNSSLETYNIEPPWYGLAYIMRVRK